MTDKKDFSALDQFIGMSMLELQMEFVKRTAIKCSGNMSKTARTLRVTDRTLRNYKNKGLLTLEPGKN